MIRIIDVSSWQGPSLDCDAMRAAGAEALIVKLTDKNGGINKHAHEQIRRGLTAGLLVAIYHFAGPNGPNWTEDAIAEADFLDREANVFEAEFKTKFPTFLDVERNSPLTSVEKPYWRDWTNEFRDECSLRGRPIHWYSGKYFTQDLHLTQDWENRLLWQAQYPGTWKANGLYTFRDVGAQSPIPDCLWWPDAALPWARVDLHQDGGDANKAHWPGVPTPYADTSRFAGTRAALEELISAIR